MVVVYLGIESIRVLLNIKAPLLIFLGLALLGWALWRAHGLGPMLSQPSAFAMGQPKHGQFFPIFIASLTGNIGFWATLSLNIPDFSRYARSQRSQVIGQAVGLPTTMALYSFIGVAVTSATIVIFGHAIWDPVDLLVKLQNPVLLIIAMVSLCIATLATNLAANVVSPANDFANLAPRFIGFRMGGLITGLVGILIQPWRLMADPSLFIFTWLGGYSSLLGAIGGVLIVDYILIRRANLDLPKLYQPDGGYWYVAGFNPVAIVSLLIGIAPCVPGFLDTVHLAHFGEGWVSLYNYAWFISFFAAGVCYAIGSKLLAQSNVEL